MTERTYTEDEIRRALMREFDWGQGASDLLVEYLNKPAGPAFSRYQIVINPDGDVAYYWGPDLVGTFRHPNTQEVGPLYCLKDDVMEAIGLLRESLGVLVTDDCCVTLVSDIQEALARLPEDLK